ncbi:hypothetical protein, partial [Pseudomonas syringae group genomosp. 7]|uniref:hypothetical protein n=1 Tax=Pseudomonas syringae group genomosp. 7 TaxID=251699 RepID=UPI00376FC1CA
PRQNYRFLPLNCRATFELVVDKHRHFQTAYCWANHIGIRYAAEKIATHRNESFHLAAKQCL